MKAAIKKIDRALKDLNQLETTQKAEQYLISHSPLHVESQENTEEYHGALLVRSLGVKNLSVGIYLNQNVTTALNEVKNWDPRYWSPRQVKAVTVATEEVSHFHYVLTNASQGRQISQFELELQAEIDKFMLLFFALEPNREESERTFEKLFEMLFERFHFKEELAESEKQRYAEANDIAKNFVIKCRGHLESKDYESALKLLRQFYRLSSSEKISLVLRK